MLGNDSNKPNKALNATVVKLGLVSFFADIASEMLYPITPIFLTVVIGASMANLGIMEGIAEAIASLMKVYSGAWSDRISKRKPFIIVGYSLGAISKPLTGLATAWTGVLLARAIDRTGKGLRSAPRDALIAESVDEDSRGAAFGWHRGMDTLGAAVGPLLAILLLSANAENLRAIYYWALVPGLISVALIFFIREPRHQRETKPWTNPFRDFGKFDGSFRQYLLAWGVFSLANSSDVFLLMKAKVSGLDTQYVILLYCAYNLVYALSSPWLGVLSDKLGRKHLMIFGLAVFSLVYIGFGFASEAWQFWSLFLIYGLYMGATDGVGKALAVDLTPPQHKATSVGILGTLTGFCTIFASAFAGYLWDAFGSRWAFFYGSFGALAAIPFLLMIRQGKAN